MPRSQSFIDKTFITDSLQKYSTFAASDSKFVLSPSSESEVALI
jgi:hypothetical protein